MHPERDLNKMLARDPAELARMAIGVLRARAMTGGILATMKLRALSRVADPERFSKSRGTAIRALAIFLKRAVIAVKNPDGASVWEEPTLRQEIQDLPKNPSLDFEGWFEVAWKMYFHSSLNGDLKNDPIMWALAEKAQVKSSSSKGHGEKPQDLIKKRVKASAKLCW
jgi:hypothetical protein